MINKARRIMIVDPRHLQRLRLERDFNQQGYYAIAPVSSLQEMLTVLEYGDYVFDLVLINASLVDDAGFYLPDFCQDNPAIREAFIYDAPQTVWRSVQIKGRLCRSTERALIG